MTLSVVDIYQKILPRTNCGDCGFPTCLAFASMVVSEKLPLKYCPHLDELEIQTHQAELDAQHQAGKWTKKDMAGDALEWAKERSASMALHDLPARIGGVLVRRNGDVALELPYFTGKIYITGEKVINEAGDELNRWEQVFIYNHMAQGGDVLPGENWRGLEQIPNTVSKIKSMRSHVEAPLIKHFRGQPDALREAAVSLGGVDVGAQQETADVAFRFQPLPRIPLLLVFWDEDVAEGFAPRVKVLFDETITEHLDIESILFLSERLRQLLCGEDEH